MRLTTTILTLGICVLLGCSSPSDDAVSNSNAQEQAVQSRSEQESENADGRQAIFYESMEAEYRAQREARELYPVSTMEEIKRNASKFGPLSGELTDRYLDQVAEKHGITREELGAIQLEGTEKKWPVP